LLATYNGILKISYGGIGIGMVLLLLWVCFL